MYNWNTEMLWQLWISVDGQCRPYLISNEQGRDKRDRSKDMIFAGKLGQSFE